MTAVSILCNRWFLSIRHLAGCAMLLGLVGCTGGRHFHTINPGTTTSTQPYLELRSEVSAGTLHFPAGVYTLDAMDDKGYYYRAPRKIVQRSFSGGLPHDGGIFVEKRDRNRLRGYVIMPGGLTHVGNLSRSDYAFRSDAEVAPAEQPPANGHE